MPDPAHKHIDIADAGRHARTTTRRGARPVHGTSAPRTQPPGMARSRDASRAGRGGGKQCHRPGGQRALAHDPRRLAALRSRRRKTGVRRFPGVAHRGVGGLAPLLFLTLGRGTIIALLLVRFRLFPLQHRLFPFPQRGVERPAQIVQRPKIRVARLPQPVKGVALHGDVHHLPHEQGVNRRCDAHPAAHTRSIRCRSPGGAPAPPSP